MDKIQLTTRNMKIYLLYKPDLCSDIEHIRNWAFCLKKINDPYQE